MTRLTHLFTALALSGVLVGAAIAACGVRPGTPGEMPPLAPRPERLDPMAIPVPSALDPGEGSTDALDAGKLSPGPVTSLGAPAVFRVAEPQQAGSGRDAGASTPGPGDAGGGTVDAGAGGADAGPPSPTTPAPIDASVIDSYTPPLPPIPDGGIPADSRMEPIRLRD
jgi:hypothetical protein